MGSDSYHQQSLFETFFSSIKITHGSAESARTVGHEFREMIHTKRPSTTILGASDTLVIDRRVPKL